MCVCYLASMISLSQETEALATRLAAAKRVSVEEAIRQALEAQVRTLGTEPWRRSGCMAGEAGSGRKRFASGST